MKLKQVLQSLMMLCVSIVATSSMARVLDMPAEPATPSVGESVSVSLPGRGMTMDQVEARFGAPSEKVEAIGEPPISRWIYSSFTVYFERNIVLHSVTHK